MTWTVGVLLAAMAVIVGLWVAAELLLRWANDQDFRDECERRSEDEEWRP